MRIFDSMDGSVRMELTSADLSASLRTINGMQIPIHNLQLIDDLTAHFTVSRRALKQIQNMAQRKGERVEVFSHIGMFWYLWRLRKRPVLYAGMTLLLMLALFLPTRVMFVEVEGNHRMPSRLIVEAAQDAGISFGASRRAVRSERIKNELLGALPQLQWAGVNTYGCRAVISVRERAPENQTADEYVLSNVVASCDGVITSVTVTGGSGVCVIGQAVQEGQLLISGYTDCGGVVTAGRAEGEIFAQTRHEITAVTPCEIKIRTHSDKIQTNYSLCIGKKRINFYKGSGISDGSCVKMVTQYHLTLPGGYELPLSIIKEQRTGYQTRVNQIDAAQLTGQLSAFSKILLHSEGVALTIIDVQETVDTENGLTVLSGIYNCTEMIGRELGEQIGDFHGKTD